ncbi:uncharacterized protein LOC112494289 [Cephus cinctus]|uniref:Uncharacterized protein LOC112494289 n=1 Tax=Cephus cinctus TaxID=211228 RepID=A0AAJ7RGA0_CEPCN|nr:uncharacterized protein LOC112494289 [Cephus cinctus]
MANESDNDFEMDMEAIFVDSAAGERDDPAQPAQARPPVAQPGQGPQQASGQVRLPARSNREADEARNYQRRGNHAGRRARQNYAEAFLCRMLRKLASQGPYRARGRGGRRGGRGGG